jgi:fructose-1,6-bisphosphatase/inositol monophosphatase family enzyme
VESKPDLTLVSDADKSAEELVRGQLKRTRPRDAVEGEEFETTGHGPRRWVIDPIDGTHNFVAGSPRFAVLVALARQGELLASWTYAPELDLMATAAKGGGAFVDGERVRVRPAHGLRFLDVTTSQPKWWDEEQRSQSNTLCGHGVSLAFFDTSGLEYLELAAGRRSAMILGWEFPWDHAAGILLHAEAGGVTMTADGSPFRLSGGNALPFVSAPDAATAQLIVEGLTHRRM